MARFMTPNADLLREAVDGSTAAGARPTRQGSMKSEEFDRAFC
jgi:hypothetical protein